MVGVVHYEVDVETQSGSIGVSAVHPARQGKGIGTLMYDHVLDAMRAQGVKYATADTEGDTSHAPARRVYEKLGFVAVPMVHYHMNLGQPRAPRRPRADRPATRSGSCKRKKVPSMMVGLSLCRLSGTNRVKIYLLQKRGLGNQFSLFAAGLYFARKYGAALEILREPEERAVSFGHPRPFLLSKYCITTPFRESRLQDRLMCSVATAKKPVAATARLFSRTVVYRQPCLEDRVFLPALPIRSWTRRVYLDGNYQAYQYAQSVEERLRAELRLREPATGRNLETLRQIGALENPVSIHVRRGDYALWSGGPQVLPADYYRRAWEIIRQKIANPFCFVFSDDIAFAREILPKSERMVFVDNNDEAHGFEDLRLMSACRHHVIANSTFSWWGAWLDPNPAKLVCAPNGWGLADPKEAHPDMLPEAWLRIDTSRAAAVAANSGH